MSSSNSVHEYSKVHFIPNGNKKFASYSNPKDLFLTEEKYNFQGTTSSSASNDYNLSSPTEIGITQVQKLDSFITFKNRDYENEFYTAGYNKLFFNPKD